LRSLSSSGDNNPW